MKISFIGKNLVAVPESEFGRVSFCCVQAIVSLEALGEFVESITIDFVYLNNMLGPAIRINFRKIREKTFWTSTDFRLIRQDKDDKRHYLEQSNDFIIKFLAQEVSETLPKLLQKQKLDLQGDIEKILVACPSC